MSKTKKSSKILCDPYLWENPSVLAYTGLWGPNKEACVSEIVNHIVLATSVFGLIGFTLGRVTRSAIPMGLAGILFFVIVGPSLVLAFKRSRQYEGYQNKNSPGEESVVVVSAPSVVRVLRPGETTPTARNPFMNVLLDEYKYNPKRPAAASVNDPNIQVTLDDFFRTEFVRDPTDVFGRSQSQRQFVTMPSTSIPNDQESFQNWLYKIPGKTCKEGGREACLPGTDGGAVTWLHPDI